MSEQEVNKKMERLRKCYKDMCRGRAVVEFQLRTMKDAGICQASLIDNTGDYPALLMVDVHVLAVSSSETTPKAMTTHNWKLLEDRIVRWEDVEWLIPSTEEALKTASGQPIGGGG